MTDDIYIQHEELLQSGYVHRVTRSDTSRMVSDVDELRKSFVTLPVDPYASGTGRSRVYGRALYRHWAQSFEWLPDIVSNGNHVQPYDQGTFNQDFFQTRYLPALPEPVQAATHLAGLIDHALRVVTLKETFRIWPVYIGVHLIRLSVSAGAAQAVTTPNVLHQDGGTDMFTFVHLMSIANVCGGETTVARPEQAGKFPNELGDDEVLARFSLSSPGDWYAVNDEAVSHHASAVQPFDSRISCVRDIVLLGVSPYQPSFA